MWDWHDGASGWAWLWMIVMMALIWLPLLVALVWLLVRFGRPAERSGDIDRARDVDAREIARRAYARGEIDRARYLQIMEDLEHGRTGTRREES